MAIEAAGDTLIVLLTVPSFAHLTCKPTRNLSECEALLDDVFEIQTRSAAPALRRVHADHPTWRQIRIWHVRKRKSHDFQNDV